MYYHTTIMTRPSTDVKWPHEMSFTSEFKKPRFRVLSADLQSVNFVLSDDQLTRTAIRSFSSQDAMDKIEQTFNDPDHLSYKIKRYCDDVGIVITFM